MTRTRINIEFGHMTNTWITRTAAKLGITKTELCRQIIFNASIYGIDEKAVVDGATENRQWSNQARALTQSVRRRPQPQSTPTHPPA